MTFEDHIWREAGRRGCSLPPPQNPEPLASLPYETELGVKQSALSAFWKEQGLSTSPAAVVAAEEPRGYRSTSTRRAYGRDGRLALGFPGVATTGAGLTGSALDPPEHLDVYRFVLGVCQKPTVQPLAAVLNFAIVRGLKKQLALILNLRAFDARVVRAAKVLGDELRRAGLAQAAFLYLDPRGSDYYLEARRPEKMLSWKRLYGPEWLEVRVLDRRLRFPPTVFSQINQSMLPLMAGAVRDRLMPLAGHALLDLYCGYGLFSLTVGLLADEVTGIDSSGGAVEAARQNAEHPRVDRPVRFIAAGIDRGFVDSHVRRARLPELVILDPPRGGTERGVVEALAARRPLRVLHICCGINEAPREIAAWMGGGYRLQEVVPLDLFAGTANVELLLAFVRMKS